MWSATRARRLPMAASSATRVSRTLTMANSATTKNALTRTRRTTPMISIDGRAHRGVTRQAGRTGESDASRIVGRVHFAMPKHSISDVRRSGSARSHGCRRAGTRDCLHTDRSRLLASRPGATCRPGPCAGRSPAWPCPRCARSMPGSLKATFTLTPMMSLTFFWMLLLEIDEGVVLGEHRDVVQREDGLRDLLVEGWARSPPAPPWCPWRPCGSPPAGSAAPPGATSAAPTPPGWGRR